MSTHKCEVFEITELREAKGLENLKYIDFGYYPCLVSKNDYKPGDLAVYIPPDSLVNIDTPRFSFLKKLDKYKSKSGMVRITAQKFRGNQSMGLVLPAPEGTKPGDDVAQLWGIEHWNEPEREEATSKAKTKPKLPWYKKLFGIFSAKNKPNWYPPVPGPTYDVESWYRYGNMFGENEPIRITEKIHGTNAGFTLQYQKPRWPWQKPEKKIFVRSRTLYKKPGDTYTGFYKEDVWWDVFDRTPALQDQVLKYPNKIFYGEIYGPKIQKSVKYAVKTPAIRLFDVFDTEAYNWVSEEDQLKIQVEPTLWVPMLYTGPHIAETVKSYISGKNFENTDIREGIVISSMIRRLKLKAVSPEYLER